MATPSTSTAILLRQSLSDALGLPADQVPLEANLIEWGLDSVTLIRLAGQWRRQGLAARFAELVADPRLCAWLALLDTAPTATAPISTSIDDSLPFELAPMQHAYWIGRAPANSWVAWPRTSITSSMARTLTRYGWKRPCVPCSRGTLCCGRSFSMTAASRSSRTARGQD